MANWTDLDISNPSYWPLIGTQVGTNGGGGNGAVVFAITSGGVITQLNIINPNPTSGSYTSNFPATFTGGGTAATATFTVAGGIITGYTSLVGGTGWLGTAPAWKLNTPANVWSTLLTSIATLRAGINGNTQTISNLGGLYLTSGYISNTSTLAFTVMDASGGPGGFGYHRLKVDNNSWQIAAGGSTTGLNQLYIYDETAAAMRFIIRRNGIVNIGTAPIYANDAAAGSAGLVTGDVWVDTSGNMHRKL